jgi:hypothetical protein
LDMGVVMAHVIVICGWGSRRRTRTVRPALAWSASTRGIHVPDGSAVLPEFARRWGCGCEVVCELFRTCCEGLAPNSAGVGYMPGSLARFDL